jgi:hypothetical protein
MSFNINQIKEGYGSDRLEWSDYPDNHDPHRCGSAPFSPQIMPDGTQNSCGSYCDGFDKKGCNKYLPNYPDDYYLMNYAAKHGNCDGFDDCKREITPVNQACESTQSGYGISRTNQVGPGINYPIIENFGMFPETPFGVVLWLLFLYLIAQILFGKN